MSLISRHLVQAPRFQLNTPYAALRDASVEDDIEYKPSRPDFIKQPKQKTEETNRMATNTSEQPDHPTVLIPGPIEFDQEVLQSMSHYRYDS